MAANLGDARVMAREMWKIGGNCFDQTADALETAINATAAGRRVFVDSADPDDEERGSWFRWQICEAAEQLGYYANILDVAGWVRLGVMTEQGRSEILLSLHSIGRGYTGVFGASLSFYRRRGYGVGRVVDLRAATTAPFEIHYQDSLESKTRLFHRWLNNGLDRALTFWSDGE